jgi:hypothetical protein
MKLRHRPTPVAAGKKTIAALATGSFSESFRFGYLWIAAVHDFFMQRIDAA